MNQDGNIGLREYKGTERRSQLYQKEKLGLKKKCKLSELNGKQGVKRKGLKTVIEELKQRMLAKSAKLRRYEQRIKQF